MIVTDRRLRMMNEIICAMRVIKMYAWEHAFQKVVEKLRRCFNNYYYQRVQAQPFNHT